MNALRTLMMVLVLVGAAGSAATATVEMANLVPADAKAVIEGANGAELRQALLDSRFWKALEQTQGVKEWRASPRHLEMRERVDQFLATLKMDEKTALQSYLGGRSAVVLLPSDQKKPWGVILTEATNEHAKQLVEAAGGQEVKRHRGVAIYEVQKDNRLDRMAFAGDVFIATSAGGDALERVLNVIVAGGPSVPASPSLGAEGHFAKAVEGLPAGWSVRAYAAETAPRKSPGAVAMYLKGTSGLHFEWRIVSGEGDISMTAPVELTGPRAIPDNAVVTVASSFHPAAIWKTVKAKLGAEGEAGAVKLSRSEMFIRGWFPGQTMDSIVTAFGPEAAMALLKGDQGGAPSLLGLVKIADRGETAAKAFRDGLAAKAMLLMALAAQNENAPKISVREEAYGNAQLVIIEAPGVLDKFVGDWAKDIALTVAVTNQWVIIGTTPAGVKATIDTASAANGAGSLAAAMANDGVPVPTKPLTRWGVIKPASGADIVLSLAERVAGTERVEQVKKLTNLAEVMKLIKRMVWTRVDEPTVISGQADIQAIDE